MKHEARCETMDYHQYLSETLTFILRLFYLSICVFISLFISFFIYNLHAYCSSNKSNQIPNDMKDVTTSKAKNLKVEKESVLARASNTAVAKGAKEDERRGKGDDKQQVGLEEKEEEEEEENEEIIEVEKKSMTSRNLLKKGKGLNEQGIKARKLPKAIKENPPSKGKNISSKEKREGKKLESGERIGPCKGK